MGVTGGLFQFEIDYFRHCLNQTKQLILSAPRSFRRVGVRAAADDFMRAGKVALRLFVWPAIHVLMDWLILLQQHKNTFSDKNIWYWINFGAFSDQNDVIARAKSPTLRIFPGKPYPGPGVIQIVVFCSCTDHDLMMISSFRWYTVDPRRPK